MWKTYNRVCMKIDLDAVEYNFDLLRKGVSPDTKMVAVIKADGYGHGSVQIANILEPKESMWGCATATLDEAVFLRNGGFQKPILVLGAVFPEQRQRMIEQEIRMTTYSEEMAEEVSSLAVKMGKKAYIHIKIDTGMSRIGFPADQESVKIIERISQMPNLELEGMYTHFAKADESDKAFTQKQIDQYLWMKTNLEKKGITFSYYHCSNSAGIMEMPEANMDLVRAGISMYGLYPSMDIMRNCEEPLKPAMELISHITHVKWVEAGTPVSYGGTFVTQKKTKIATIPVGYGDGYPRSLSNEGYVLIHGKAARILGRVCMDQMMVDVTDIENVRFGDEVTLIGYNGNAHLRAEVLGELSDRFNYELVCDLSKRIPREYYRHGEIVEQTDYFG